MVSIYLIEDCDGLKYVGSTVSKLNIRLNHHKSHKRIGQYCSSSKLNLDNCMIMELEHCNLEHRTEREKYWINEIDCVNEIKFDFDKEKKKEYQKEYQKEYIKIDWYCSHCDCNVKLSHKARHLKSKKHQLKINVCINKDDSKKVCN